MLGIVPILSAIQPEVAPALAVTALIPVVLAVPIRSGRPMIVLMAGAVASGSGAIVLAQLAVGSLQHASAAALLSLVGLPIAYGVLLAFLWNVSARMKGSAGRLASAVEMSRDLSRTLDPNLVGDRIARHIALAVGADECGVNYLDLSGRRLFTHGYYPAERRTDADPTYSLDEYPASDRAVRDQLPYLVDVSDPMGDAAAAAFLRAAGYASMAVVPLVAAGRTIGTVECLSRRERAFDHDTIGLASMLADEAAMVLENARLYDAIRHQAFHDALTGLANRVLFRERLEHALNRILGRSDRLVGILFVDLDDFKLLNDRLGHAGGDEILVEAAGRVMATLRPGDTAARLGGDEFAILLEDLESEAGAVAVAERLRRALERPMLRGGGASSVSASIGIAVSGTAGERVEDLLRNADLAMYAAKARGRGLYAVYGQEMRAQWAARAERGGQLAGAAERGELRLEFQPIVDLGLTEINGLEALVRWQPANGPCLGPADFIAIAEQTGAIVPIGRWVLREACRQVRAWQVRLDLPELDVSVNVSARELQEPGFVDGVLAVLTEHQLDPAHLVLELTESVLMRHADQAVGRLADLRAIGVRVAIDDFGTGYSSLSYLHRFAVDILKIDRSFVAGLERDDGRSVLASAIISLAGALGLEVIAEGIEEPAQADVLRALGCGYGQGYLYSRPVGHDAMENLLSVPTPFPMTAPAGTGRRARERSRTTLRLVSG